jgi:hypothetical protein
MSSRPIADAIQCPVCHTWVENVTLCSWCTVELATGSWRRCDPVLAARALRRLPPSMFEIPTRGLRPECGTDNGERAHRRHGEKPCDACKAAHSAAVIRRRRARTERMAEVAA